MTTEIICGDCLEVLPTLEPESFHACVTDPPYHLTNVAYDFRKTGAGNDRPPRIIRSAGFMNQSWDGGDVAFRPETWAEVWRVLKPGAYLLAFGGTRTYHRLACAIEDAGFEIRDTIMWLYGSGFPKSHDVSKAIDRAASAEREVVGLNPTYRAMQADASAYNLSRNPFITAPATEAARQWQGWGTALKPAVEPIVVARKPLSEGTVAANVLRHGTGALNIDASRIPAVSGDEPAKWESPRGGIWATDSDAKAALTTNANGRWPANVAHDSSPEVLDAFARFADGMHGAGHARDAIREADKTGMWGFAGDGQRYGDTGTAARFFKECPPDAEEQKGRWPANVAHDGSEEVLAAFPQSGPPCGSAKQQDSEQSRIGMRIAASAGTNAAYVGDTGTAARFFFCAKADTSERVGNHPTVKPVSLMEWLVGLVTPPGGRVLDPFCGTGSTLVACDRLGFEAVGIEQDAQTVADAHEKLKRMRARRMIGDAARAPALEGQLKLDL